MVLSREQVAQLYKLARLAEHRDQVSGHIAALERELWHAGVSAAQLAAMLGESKARTNRRLQGRLSTPQLTEVFNGQLSRAGATQEST